MGDSKGRNQNNMYDEIFEEIVSIMQKDYSGCKDKQGWDNPEFYRGILKGNKREITPDEFVELVKDYLIDFKDNHIHFVRTQKNKEQRKERGFKVRRFEDMLYVTSVKNEKNITVGSVISALDGIPIMELREKYHRNLNENHPERENWNPILLKHENCTIVNEDQTTTILTMKKFDKGPSTPTYSIEKMKEGPILVTLTDFADPDTISSLIRDHATLLEAAESIIVDVRSNAGGTDSSFTELLPYLFPVEEKELFNPAIHTMLYNCTERTCDLQIQMIDESLATIKDENTREMLSGFKRFFEENYGKGFVNINEDAHNSFIMKGKALPKKVVVLTDVYCGSSGDSFVEACKLSDKVTVVGRPTAGLNDYTNLTIMKWEEGFELWYPTSKLRRVDDGKGMSGIGIESDVYIPWTPRHIEEDIDIKKALELIHSA